MARSSSHHGNVLRHGAERSARTPSRDTDVPSSVIDDYPGSEMPVLTYHLVQGQHSDDELAVLLTRSATLFAEVTQSPVDRIRVMADERPPQRVCVGDTLVTDSGASAPFFTFWLMKGRPIEQAHQLMAGFTELLVETLGVDRSSIRGVVTMVEPEQWAIAGVPASVARQREIDARAAASGGSVA